MAYEVSLGQWDEYVCKGYVTVTKISSMLISHMVNETVLFSTNPYIKSGK